MFTSKTVFIVGAGASSELGFPVGAQLCDTIRASLNCWIDPAGAVEGEDRELSSLISRLAAESGESMVGYVQAAAAVRQGLSVWPSIDNCLHAHRANPRAIRCGKLGIARAILNHEATSPLLAQGRRPLNLASKEIRESYLPALASQIIVDCSDLSDELFRNIAFVIFNYDRCIEEYLFHALQQAYGAPEEKVAEVLNRARFVHPYGSLGRLPWQSGIGKAVPFGAQADQTDLIHIAEQIRTFTESHDDREFHSLIQDTYSGAERAVFLGFAFNGQNMDLLSGRQTTPKRALVRTVYATSFGISQESEYPIKSSIAGSLPGVAPNHVSMTLLAERCSAFMSRLQRVLIS